MHMPGITGLIITLLALILGSFIGALMIMLGAKLVTGRAATFWSAFFTNIASSFAGLVLGGIAGFAISFVLPGVDSAAAIAGGVAGFVAAPLIYTALLRLKDGTKPSYLQSLLIYLFQLAVAVVVWAIAIFVFRVPVAGVPFS
jgi:hypothetical protein